MGKAAKFLYLLSGRLVPLLDEYSGAAAAYSLRSLTSSSTTNVVKVRRSGDDAELDFTADKVSDGTLAAWVVAGGGTEDGFVTTWYDQSGNTNNATQATAASQPKIVSSGTLVTENGKAALDFDGTDDYFTTNLTIDGFSLFVVHKLNSSGTYVFIASNTDGTNAERIATRTNAGNAYEIDNPDTVSGGDQSLNQALLSVFEKSTDELYLNSSQIASGVSGSKAFTSIDLFARKTTDQFFMDGLVQELIIYDSDQSANRTGIEANINAHYNIFS